MYSPDYALNQPLSICLAPQAQDFPAVFNNLGQTGKSDITTPICGLQRYLSSLLFILHQLHFLPLIVLTGSKPMPSTWLRKIFRLGASELGFNSWHCQLVTIYVTGGYYLSSLTLFSFLRKMRYRIFTLPGHCKNWKDNVLK